MKYKIKFSLWSQKYPLQSFHMHELFQQKPRFEPIHLSRLISLPSKSPRFRNNFARLWPFNKIRYSHSCQRLTSKAMEVSHCYFVSRHSFWEDSWFLDINRCSMSVGQSVSNGWVLRPIKLCSGCSVEYETTASLLSWSVSVAYTECAVSI